MVKQSKRDLVRDQAIEYLINEKLTRAEAISKALKALNQQGGTEKIQSINGAITMYLRNNPEISKKVKAQKEGGDGKGDTEGDGEIKEQKNEGKGAQIKTPKTKIVDAVDPPVKVVDYIGAFQQLDTGTTVTDLMADFKLDPDQLIKLIEKWNTIKEKMWEKDAVEAKYVPAWYEIARTMGEQIRDGCEHFQDTSGICDLWNFTKADSEFRQKFAGLFKIDGGKLRPRVGEHPEICATCHRGLAFSTTAAS